MQPIETKHQSQRPLLQRMETAGQTAANGRSSVYVDKDDGQTHTHTADTQSTVVQCPSVADSFELANTQGNRKPAIQ